MRKKQSTKPKQVDLIPESERAARVAAQEVAIRRQLRGSPFADAPMVAVAAAVGGEKVAAVTEEDSSPPLGMDDLVSALCDAMPYPARSADGPLYVAVDHCFPIKGQGTVLTGTVLSGGVKVGETVELPALGEKRKVKSLQSFHRAVQCAGQGDRVGLCVTNLDAKLMERGVLCAPGSVGRVERALAVVKRVRAFRGQMRSGQKVHMSLGHVTVMARATFFGARELLLQAAAASAGGDGDGAASAAAAVEEGKEEKEGEGAGDGGDGGGVGVGVPSLAFDWAQEFEHQEELVGREREARATWGEEGEQEGTKGGTGGGGGCLLPQFVLLEFDAPVLAPLQTLVIGSRLNGEFGAVGGGAAAAAGAGGGGRKEAATGGGGGGGGGGPCRLAFYGTLLESLRAKDVRRVRIYKHKLREGTIHRLGACDTDSEGVVRCREATGQGLFKKETDLRPFVGMRVETRDGQTGRVEAGFGKGGKFRVRFDGSGAVGVNPGDRLYLRFRRFVHDPEKRMVQSATPLPPVGGGYRPRQRTAGGGRGGGEGLVDDYGVVNSGGEVAATVAVVDSSDEEEGSGEGEGEEAAGAVVAEAVTVVDGVDLSALETDFAALPPPSHHHPLSSSLRPAPAPRQQQQAAALLSLSIPSSAASGPTSSLCPPAVGTPHGNGSGSGGLEARFGVVDTVRPEGLVIVKGFFSMEEDVRQFAGMRVVVAEERAEGGEGVVVGPFGKGGKAKVQFSGGFSGEVGAKLTLYVEHQRGP